jgi:cell division protein FtsL
MKKVFKSRILLLVLLFILLISAFSFIAYSKTRSLCSNTGECTIKTESNSSSEMLWDVLSRQFVSTVHLP